MRKLTVFILLSISLFFASEKVFAEWDYANPRITGGSLTRRSEASMAPLGNGRILLHGGYTGDDDMDDTWVYDIQKNHWHNMSPVINNYEFYFSYHQNQGMAYLGSQSVLVYGGEPYGEYTWKYDYATNSWTYLTPDEIGGSLGRLLSHGMCYIEDGKALLFGGYYDGTRYDHTWLYDNSLNQWIKKEPELAGAIPGSRRDFGMAYIGNSKAVIFGGTGSGLLNDTWVYDLVQDQWTNMTPSIVGGTLSTRYGTGMAHIGGDRVILFGGYVAGGYYTNETWMYDLSDNQWTNLTQSGSGNLPSARQEMNLAFAGLDQVVMFGGYSYPPTTYFNDTWTYSIPGGVQDSIAWQIQANGLELSWSIPEDCSGAQFSIYRDGQQIAASVLPGAAVSGLIPYSYLDTGTAANKIYRYRIKADYPVMDSEVTYSEIVVPYCQ